MPSLLFLDISFGEIFIIVAVIFVVFGPQRIPEIARKIGKGMREIKKASTEIQREINTEVKQYKTDLDLERIVNESDQPEEKSISEKTKDKSATDKPKEKSKTDKPEVDAAEIEKKSE